MFSRLGDRLVFPHLKHATCFAASVESGLFSRLLAKTTCFCTLAAGSLSCLLAHATCFSAFVAFAKGSFSRL